MPATALRRRIRPCCHDARTGSWNARSSRAWGGLEVTTVARRVGPIIRRTPMLDRSSIGAVALAAALMMTPTGAAAFDDSKYPDLKGQWHRVGVPNWTPAGTAPL